MGVAAEEVRKTRLQRVTAVVCGAAIVRYLSSYTAS
jgi:hypothetical protein